MSALEAVKQIHDYCGAAIGALKGDESDEDTGRQLAFNEIQRLCKTLIAFLEDKP
jgi:hypothetical protein